MGESLKINSINRPQTTTVTQPSLSDRFEAHIPLWTLICPQYVYISSQTQVGYNAASWGSVPFSSYSWRVVVEMCYDSQSALLQTAQVNPLMPHMDFTQITTHTLNLLAVKLKSKLTKFLFILSFTIFAHFISSFIDFITLLGPHKYNQAWFCFQWGYCRKSLHYATWGWWYTEGQTDPSDLFLKYIHFTSSAILCK